MAIFVAVVDLAASQWQEWLERLLPAAWVTAQLTVIDVIGALVLGVGLALARGAKTAAVRGLALGYVEVFRGVPGLLTVYIAYFSAPAIGIELTAFQAAAAGLTLTGSAYACEIIRSGLAAVGKGQREAAAALGLGPGVSLRYVIAPQGFRVALPALTTLAIMQLQDTSLASVISTAELTNVSYELGSQTFLYLQVFVFTGVLYLLLAAPFAALARVSERRLTARQRTA